MPMVGKKEYSYTPKGIAMAKAEAKKSGKPMKRGYVHGGMAKPVLCGASNPGTQKQGKK